TERGRERAPLRCGTKRNLYYINPACRVRYRTTPTSLPALPVYRPATAHTTPAGFARRRFVWHGLVPGVSCRRCDPIPSPRTQETEHDWLSCLHGYSGPVVCPRPNGSALSPGCADRCRAHCPAPALDGTRSEGPSGPPNRAAKP